MRGMRLTNRRPEVGDEGQRIWVRLLAGFHPARTVYGVLAKWDKTVMTLKDGNEHKWEMIVDWGCGVPPATVL